MEEGSINVKALRAKFQEEALLAQSKTSKPAVMEKPKHLTPSGGHCSSVVSSINIAVVNKTAVVPRVIFRDGLRASGGRRPISFPPQPQQTSPTSHLGHEHSTARQSLKDRQMPLVLPVPPVTHQKAELPPKKEHKLEPEPGKEVVPQTKIKKKGLLLPFKSSKAPKVNAENLEEPTYVDLTIRPSSAPAELPYVEKQRTDDGVSLQSDQSTADLGLTSPNFPTTPPPVESSVDNKIINTLERAKKKFSYKQMLISAKPKGLRSPDYASRDKAFPSPPKKAESGEPEPLVPSPVGLPHLACISARPFFKADNSGHKSTLNKNFRKGQAELRSDTSGHPHPAPPKKPLPEITSIRPAPPKPLRPPLVDLSCYHLSSANEVSPPNSQILSEEPEFEHASPVLDAPEFPDFDNTEMESEGVEVVDIAALNLEALDLVSTELPAPDGCGVTDFEDPLPALSSCDPVEPLMSTTIQDLNVGSQNIIHFDPVGFSEPINISEFPEPPSSEQWFQSEEVSIDPQTNSQADEADLGMAQFHSSVQEMDSGNHVSLDDGAQSHSSMYQQDSYYEACDNVYEDVENLNKMISGQNSQKRKGVLKNPYADNHSTKEEASLNKWPRHPWSSAPGEHVHPAHTHVLGKERQSPNTAEHKEQKKREKQRLEKEKKEQKERERKENEMKKKFKVGDSTTSQVLVPPSETFSQPPCFCPLPNMWKVTGEEEPMYHAKVVVTRKVRKNDLPVKSGDTVSVIRTTSCPKGKWLARDANNKYGYISVMNVELNIKEMLELGKKAKAAGRGASMEADTISIGSRSSSHPVLTSSFTDDSEEWACEDETVSFSNESHNFSRQTASIPETSCGHVSAQHTLSDANLEELHTQTRHEALQKLAIFFQHTKEEFGDLSESGGATPTNADAPNFLCAVEEPPYPEQDIDFTELELLPPPPLYADTY